ncbi:UDP-N-acetylmuramate dehydrogenase [Sneathiella glossodoripedis]|uniref:UDP-N-acetylmuramate dehydrogenase n=1 Tax=Sneathiella glossodoripedis TaxID=418853 RepID=UPI00046FCFD3|nr:UDP-N-acetylmuramate dehydrogenase [Sneathiella glossodoripedis]
MNQPSIRSISICERLPEVRGRIRENARLDKVTWFQVGGPADVLFKPDDEDDLSQFLRETPADIPVFTLGVGSNLLVRDGGYRGVVIRLGRNFTNVELLENHRVRAGAGALDLFVARFAAENCLTGAEFLSGIPGSIGGALRMNAGAYGTELQDILVSAVAFDRDGRRHELSCENMGFSYRHCSIPDDWIFTEATLQLREGDAAEIRGQMEQIAKSREDSQPIKSRTGGSTFANPQGAKAWELIDAVGARGLRVGNAQISEMHCNFLINTGGATAADIEAVGEEARRRVFEKFDRLLRWEIVRIGEHLKDNEKAE